MVKIQTLPDPNVIRAFRGHVDFYTWKGIAIARGWPKKPDQSRAPNIRLQQPHLKDATIAYRALDFGMLEHLRETARFGTFTARDVFMKHYFGTSLETIGMSSRATHQHLYGRGPALLGLRRGRLLRLGAQAHTPEASHRPPPAFPHPDPYEHYWYLNSIFMLIDGAGHLIVQAFPNLPGRYILTTARSLPSLTWVRSRRRGITRTAYPDWQDNNASAFLGESTIPPFNQVFWDLNVIQNFRPDQYTTFVITRKHEGSGVECWSRSPLFVSFVRPAQDYIDGGGFPKSEWGIPRPVGPGYAAPALRGETLYPHEKPWPSSGPPPTPPFWD